MCGAVGYVCCMLCYRPSIQAMVPRNLIQKSWSDMVPHGPTVGDLKF